MHQMLKTNRQAYRIRGSQEGRLRLDIPRRTSPMLKIQSRAKSIFLLGSIDNFDEVKAAADEYIWMNIPLETLIARLDTREKEYGKSDSERQLILALYKTMSSTLWQDVQLITFFKSSATDHSLQPN
jgi:hypothetical protein